ncbi:DUF4348 domain-containing protein [Robertkochia solimangrovi]|uniref:DUF4348 domain-containing protein n=1 Tax=Robertkochia solimangrovi TaxID=2213046 RepID=UPI00117EEA85|nr:DUF4348 domain-containing protein [Robertkochia solimangrovi]TRZ41645.1 hypothetical protein DMZ48_16690 [Robertkochia solimangrovi]
MINNKISLFLSLIIFINCKNGNNLNSQKNSSQELLHNEKVSNSIDSQLNEIQTTNHTQEFTICDRDFFRFFGKFKNDSLFQVNKIKFPLQSIYPSDDLESDYNIIDSISQQEYKFINFSRHEDGWKKEINAFNIELENLENIYLYRLKGIDNGINMTYKFQFIDSCWYLVAMENYST